MILLRTVFVAALGVHVVAAGLGVRLAGEHAGQARENADPRTLLEQGLYSDAEEAARADVDRLATGAADPRTVATAIDVLVKALILNGKGSLSPTIALAERALTIREGLQGSASNDLAASLTNLGVSLGEAAIHPRAIALLQRAVSIRQASPEHGSLLAETLDALGVEFVRAGRYSESIDRLQQSLTLRERNGTDPTGLTTTLNALVLALQRKGDYAEARVRLDRAMSTSRDRVHPVRVTTLTLLGQQLWFEGSWREARSASAEAVQLAERVLRPDHPEAALAVRYLAATMLDLGDIVEARRLHERALAMAQRSLGAHHHEISAYLSGLGESTRHSGDYAGARTLYERALAIAEPTLGPAHMWVAGILHNLALVDARLGDYAGAQRRQARSIAIWERALGRDHPIVSVALMELAAAHREQDAPLEAIRNLERALMIRERSLGPNHREVARTLTDLAQALMETRRPARALALATRAMGILEKADAQDTPDLAALLELYAQLQANRSDHATARTYLQRALAIKQRVFGADHPSFAETQARLAIELAYLGASNNALKAASAAEITGREHLRMMVRYLPERQALNYAATRPGGLDLMLSLAASEPSATAIGIDSLIRSRALVLDEMAKRRNAVHTAKEDGPLAADLARARQRLVNVVVRGPGTLTASRYFALVDEARRESEVAEQLLARRSALFRAELGAANVGLDEVRAALAPENALVGFVRYRHTTLTSQTTVPSYLAFVVRPAQAPIAIPLGSVDSIDALVSMWRTDVTREVANRSNRSQASRISGARLRRAVWDPLGRYLTGASHVFIVPDGTLSLVPFAALPGEPSRYVIDEGQVLHYVSAERDLATRQAVADSLALRGLLALGGPSFDDGTQLRGAAARRGVMPTNCDNLRGITFDRLDGSLREVQEVARLWNTPEERTSRVLVGREANERTFKQEAARYGVLHLATHGFFLGEGCDPPRTGERGTRAVGGLTTASSTIVDTVRRENPLLLSGLALAGANRRASVRSDDDDGILTAEEVASLNLSGVEWAVLSACGTGLGAIKAGEGVFGLRRAFQVAGARTVIMSLWSVDDQATREWMMALYDGRLQKRLSTAEAVHAATVAILRERRAKKLSTAPFYWAAFVAAGDWK